MKDLPDIPADKALQRAADAMTGFTAVHIVIGNERSIGGFDFEQIQKADRLVVVCLKKGEQQ